MPTGRGGLCTIFYDPISHVPYRNGREGTNGKENEELFFGNIIELLFFLHLVNCFFVANNSKVVGKQHLASLLKVNKK